MHRKKGFTLIELLVVIAIIALLLSIIMPALNKAKTYAQEVICKTNLHQYQLATEIYCNENNDTIPDPWRSLYNSCQGRCNGPCTVGGHAAFQGEAQRYCRWHNPDYSLQSHPEYAGPYWEYLAVTQANVCPTFTKIATKYGERHMEGNNGASACIGGPFEPQFSYSMNAIFKGGKVKKTSVRSPSQTFLWAEENMWTLDTPDLSDYVLNDNALAVSANITDCFGSFHKISTGKLSIQQDTRTYESDSGEANILLADGSATWATPEESFKYAGNDR